MVGVGHLGEHHARLYSSFHDVNLVGVVDVDQSRGKEIASRYDTEFYPDLSELLPDIQAASVVVPTEHHFDVGMELLEANRHCLIEKPMVETLAQAEQLYQTSQSRDAFMQVGHIERFNPSFVAAQEYIDDPRIIEVHRIGPFAERAANIGVVMDLMIHDIDIILSLVDSPVVDIKSVGASMLSDYEDIANARIEFENGCVANLTASRVSFETRRDITIFQDSNYVKLDYLAEDVKVCQLKNGNAQTFDDIEVIKPPVENGESLRRELLHFIHCIQEDREPVVGGPEGKNAMEVAFQVVNSMKQEDKLTNLTV